MDSPFWQYSLSIYQCRGVENECLRFQQQYKGNVNILLFCCWLGTQHLSLNSRNVTQIKRLIKFWDLEIVTALREIRLMAGKLENKQLYLTAKELELFSEQILQNALYQWYCAKKLSVSDHSTVRDNVRLYAGKLCDVDSCLTDVLKAAMVVA